MSPCINYLLQERKATPLGEIVVFNAKGAKEASSLFNLKVNEGDEYEIDSFLQSYRDGNYYCLVPKNGENNLVVATGKMDWFEFDRNGKER